MNYKYDKSYYESSNYASYLERGERYFQLASELHHEFLPKIGLGNLQEKPILDYGCAIGFMVKALKRLGYKDVSGYDVSEWAIDYGKINFGLETELGTSKEVLNTNYELVLALDVFEHMTEKNLTETIANISTNYMIIRIPVCKESGGAYVLDVSERDTTHTIRWTKKQWIDMFSANNYDVILPMCLHNIYDTPGVMCAIVRNRHANLPFTF